MEMTSAAGRVGLGAGSESGFPVLMVTEPAAVTAPSDAVMTAVPCPTTVMVPSAATVATAGSEDEKVKYAGMALTVTSNPPASTVAVRPSTLAVAPASRVKVLDVMEARTTEAPNDSNRMSSNQMV